MTSYLRKRGKKFHFRRRIPKHFQYLFKKDLVQIPLGTDSEALARQYATNFNAILDDFLNNLIHEEIDKIEDKFNELVLKSKLSGFQSFNKDSSLPQLLNQINSADKITNDKIKVQIFSKAKETQLSLSKAQKDYFDYEKGNLRGKSDAQIRKWQNPRKKAIKNFIHVIGDKSLDDLTRQDILNFRNWWVERIETEDLTANSANKDFTYVKAIIRTTLDNCSGINISLDELFRNIRLKGSEKSMRHPFSLEFIKSTLLNPDIVQLNQEAHLLMFAMTDTGARIGELVGLEEQDVILDSDMPHIRIRPNGTRALKTPQSERDIPLVGASLYAFQELHGAFKKYFGKSELISNTINKYFRENNLLPSENHTLYSLRHSFEDRLTAAEPPDKVQAALMGHKYARPRYGLGPSLEQKRFWLDKIAIEI